MNALNLFGTKWKLHGKKKKNLSGYITHYVPNCHVNIEIKKKKKR